MRSPESAINAPSESSKPQRLHSFIQFQVMETVRYPFPFSRTPTRASRRLSPRNGSQSSTR